MKLHSVKFLTLTIVMLAAHGAYSKVLAIDDCGECMGPKAKLVEGGPDKKPFKELVAATKKPIEIARKVASDGPVMMTKSTSPSKKEFQITVCDKFNFAKHPVDVETIFEEIESSPFSGDLNEFWSTPACYAENKIDTPVPVIFNTAANVIRMEKFPKVVYEYFLEEKNDQQAWLNAINTKTHDGYTFLDYIQYNFEKKNYDSPSLTAAASRIVDFLCKNGGTYSKYSGTKKCSL